MKQTIATLTVFSIACACGMTCADDRRPIPKLAELKSVVGLTVDDPQFRRMLSAYGFSENPKRNHSWGSSFGVMFERTKEKTVTAGIRPPSPATNTPTYPGELPGMLRPEDPIATIEGKLGTPERVSGDPRGQYVMQYNGMSVVTVGGRLFEVWLVPALPKAERTDEREPE